MIHKDTAIAILVMAFVIVGVLFGLALTDEWSVEPQEDVDRVAVKVSEVQQKVEEYDKVCDVFKEKLDECMTQLRFCRGY